MIIEPPSPQLLPFQEEVEQPHSLYAQAGSCQFGIRHRLERQQMNRLDVYVRFSKILPSEIDRDIRPPGRQLEPNRQPVGIMQKNIPPKIPSTALLPVLMIITPLRFSEYSIPVVNEEP